MFELQVKELHSIKDKIRGLIGYKTPEAVYFKTRWGIHTFFMHFPIDVIILDNQNEIMYTVQNLIPNRIFVWNPKYQKVIELSAGTIEKKKLKKGMHVVLTPFKKR